MPVFVFLHNYYSGPEEGERFVSLGKERIHHPLAQTLDCRIPVAPQTQSSTGELAAQWYTITTEVEGDNVHIVTDSMLFIQSIGWLRGYIGEIVAQGTPALEIVLCGARQGASMAGAALVLLLEFQLAGVCMITGTMAARETIKGWVASRGGPETLANTATPILLIHASNDRYTTAVHRQRLDRFLLDLGYRNLRPVEAMYLDPESRVVTDAMWMFVWQFVIQVLGKQP